jgi:hypothetical protein
MNKLLIICALLLTMVGCGGTAAVKTNVVLVDKPIPFCPVPPEVPSCTNFVDALTDADYTTPGKVVQAYKLDMTCYRATDKILRQVIGGYKDTSAMNKDISALFDSYGKQYEKALTPVTATVTEPVKTPLHP